MSLRDKLVTEAAWALAHEPSIHYAQTRPMPLASWKNHRLPLTTDCSGSVTCIAYTCGAPDPNGRDYDGQGYTGTLLTGSHHVDRRLVKRGDLGILVRSDGNSTHVVMFLQDAAQAADPEVFSHGQERGPIKLPLSQELAYHTGERLVCVSFVPTTADDPMITDPQPPHWVVRAGDGTVLARTRHPALWATRHSKIFRKRQRVTFHQA